VGQYILPVSSTRFVLLHYHIFKNAGTTIEYALSRCFKERFAQLHGPEASSVLSGEDALPFLLAHPEIVAISSHHLKYPKPQAPGLVVFDCCVLRDPLDRLWSMYQHFRRAEPVDDLSAKAKEVDAQSFFDLLLEEHPHLVNDVQVNVLANRAAYTRPPDSADLSAALKVAREMSAIAVVNLFDESLAAAEYFLHPAFPEIRLEYVSQNVSPARGTEERFREEVGDRIYQQLWKMNQLDSELVSWASGEVRRRFDLVPDAPRKLLDFRRRCAELRAPQGVTD
jgi:hypothetical protein